MTRLLTTLALLLSWVNIQAQMLDGARNVVDLHNRLRRLVGKTGNDRFTVTRMQTMVWNPELAVEASLFASCDVTGNAWQPLDYDLSGIPTKGVSIGIGRANSSVSSMIRRWFKEGATYDREYNVCQYGKVCQRYMQLTSAITSQVGCSIRPDCTANGKTVMVLACVYAPGLDYRLNEAAPIYEEGAICSQCEAPTVFCRRGLCSSCPYEDSNRCTCTKTCHRARVGYGILDRATCSCHCMYGAGPNCDKPCRNPEQYLDYDICAGVTPEDCGDPDPDTRAMLHEFCPERCTCRPPPKIIETLGLK